MIILVFKMRKILKYYVYLAINVIKTCRLKYSPADCVELRRERQLYRN